MPYQKVLLEEKEKFSESNTGYMAKNLQLQNKTTKKLKQKKKE
jgi:hypothetical protein